MQGENICIFVVLAQQGRILPHSSDHARAWKAAGYTVVIVVIVDRLDTDMDLNSLAFADAILYRLNRGYDFGAWSAAIQLLQPQLVASKTLAIANDSLLGPSRTFGKMVERASQLDADVIGLTESNELARHFQSFVLFFRETALKSQQFWKFWKNVRTGERQFVLENYEVPLRGIFQQAGLKVAALHPVDGSRWYNPTITECPSLLAAGFPYIKVQLLRDNPERVPLDTIYTDAAAAGFDLDQLERQIVALEQQSSFTWAFRGRR